MVFTPSGSVGLYCTVMSQERRISQRANNRTTDIIYGALSGKTNHVYIATGSVHQGKIMCTRSVCERDQVDMLPLTKKKITSEGSL